MASCPVTPPEIPVPASATRTPAVLVLADGSVFKGVSIGATGEAAGEVVFNTAMT
ncbi:MAG TPA: carbamoyl-phosphate synthase domain-containing protein, partial [Usitatibacteraceae bacterium]|nr:carbamoyl-phosphate synthase domain-containing protein [Usitatibacteraceae bacterium]